MDEIITRLIQIVVEKQQSNPQADVIELANDLKAAVERDPELARLASNRRIVQINQGDAKAFQTLVNGGIANIGTHIHSDPEAIKAVFKHFFQELQAEPIKSPPLTPQEKHHREALLNKVKNFWVKDVLEKSLYNQVLIEFGLEERPDAVVNPWSMVLETGDSSPQTLPQGTKVIDIFDQIGAGRTLLILGEPGAGKTTTLLELTRDLITRAEQDVNHLIPVVFNLSSWAVQRQEIADWLVEELKTKYDIPKEIRQDWVKKQQLLPLLDGLDEVKAEYRNDCIATLNRFKQDNGAELVVCSRIRDYETLSNRLNFQSAVYLRPLTLEQVYHYLDSAGVELSGLREFLKRDTALQELSQSPLILNIMILAYQGVGVEYLPQIEVVEELRKQLFDDYIQKMFHRPNRSKVEHPYSEVQTKRWLSWLAHRMIQEYQSEFFIENIQQNWLENRRDKLIYLLIVVLIVVPSVVPIVRLSFGLIDLLVFGESRGLSIGLIALLVFGLSVGLYVGLYVGLIGGFNSSKIETRTSPNQGIWKSLQNVVIDWLFVGLSFGLIFGLIFGLFGVLFGGLSVGLIIGLSVGLSVGLIFGMIVTGQDRISPFILRFILYPNGYIPWNYARFLDYATDRLFLQRVGGGYRFMHDLLRQHFAANYR